MSRMALDVSALRLGQKVDGTPVTKRSDRPSTRPAASEESKVRGVPVARRPGRPRSMNPLDQKVTVTITTREKALATLELRKAECPSVAELVRRRGVGSVDIGGWAEAAREALIALDRGSRERMNLRNEMARVRRAMENARVFGDEQGEIVAAEELENLKQKYESLGAAWNEKRTERVVGRFSFEDREDLAWKAERLHVSLSDFVRMQVFGYVPGQSDTHMSVDSRREFYKAVIDIETNGWGARPSLEVCRHCRTPLPHPHDH